MNCILDEHFAPDPVLCAVMAGLRAAARDMRKVMLLRLTPLQRDALARELLLRGGVGPLGGEVAEAVFGVALDVTSGPANLLCVDGCLYALDMPPWLL